MPEKIAALVSGGLDSAAMIRKLSESRARIVPVYIKCGLRWESAELAALRRWLKSFPRKRVAPLVVLSLPVRDLYGTHHWSREGKAPARRDPDEAVYLPGRNLLLVAKAAVYCTLHGIDRIALGTLEGNPFPDATEKFWNTFGQALSVGLGHSLKLVTPMAHQKKSAVIRAAGAGLLKETFSCIRPVRGFHCGRCQKCGERQTAFVRSGVCDPTRYARKLQKGDWKR